MNYSYKILIALLFLGLTQFSYSQNTYATASGLGTLTCAGSPYNNIASGNTTGAGNECGNTAADRWYSFTIAVATDVSISLCNSGYDTYLRLYNSGAANCGAATQIAQNDDNGPICGGTRSSMTQIALPAGTYIIMVEGWSSNVGAYQLDIILNNCATFPDDPCNANVITVGCSGSKITGDNTGMTNSGIAAPSCGAYAGGDVWYSITVPASGIVKVETYPLTLTDVGMSIYSVSGGCGGTLTEISCDDNSGFGNMTRTMLTGQTPGNTLYIRVWDNGNNQTGTYEIDVADMSTDYCVTGNSIDQGNGCAQLTAAVNGQVGSIWDADDKFDFTSDFTYDFTVNLGSSDAGADGITFVIQNDPAGLSAAGGAGGSMGSGGITNSLIVEIDTYWNTEDRNDGLPGSACAGGLDWDHLDIWLNGDVNPGNCTSGARYIPNAVELLNGGSSYNIENGLDHTLRISYVAATQTLTATVLNLAATVTYGVVSYSPLDPMVLFGSNAPYFGFTASTGGLNNQQSACLAPSLVLPIELLNFDVNCNDEKVKVDWATVSEINNDYFTIERSIDAINFEEVTTISGAGNSSNLISYSWVDDNPLNDVAYYRLKQTDFNGRYEYFEMKASNCKSDDEINVYPNPFTNFIQLSFNQPSKTTYTVEVKNYLGQTVLRKTVPKESLEIKLEMDSEISKGMYFLELFNEQERVITKKIMKL